MEPIRQFAARWPERKIVVSGDSAYGGRRRQSWPTQPNIARVLDSGAADSGRPYFELESVRSVPITKYGDERRLTPIAITARWCPACPRLRIDSVSRVDFRPRRDER